MKERVTVASLSAKLNEEIEHRLILQTRVNSLLQGFQVICDEIRTQGVKNTNYEAYLIAIGDILHMSKEEYAAKAKAVVERASLEEEVFEEIVEEVFEEH